MNININKIIKYLILSDISFWSAWGLVNPIFAIFIVDNIQGGSVFVVGVAVSIYWILKSLLVIPIGVFLDSLPSEKDDYLFMVLGLFIASLVPLGYLVAKVPWHIYLLQAIYGISIAISVSGWRAIFTRHIDEGREATEWSMDDAAYGSGIGISGVIGGWAVSSFGFNPVFVGAGIMGLIATFILLGLKNEIKGVFDNGIKIDFKSILKEEGNKKNE
jgi:MFS family permease